MPTEDLIFRAYDPVGGLGVSRLVLRLNAALAGGPQRPGERFLRQQAQQLTATVREENALRSEIAHV